MPEEEPHQLGKGEVYRHSSGRIFTDIEAVRQLQKEPRGSVSEKKLRRRGLNEAKRKVNADTIDKRKWGIHSNPKAACRNQWPVWWFGLLYINGSVATLCIGYLAKIRD